MTMPPWVDVAELKLGQHEIAGGSDNAFIVECLRRAGLPTEMLHDETAWCGAFAGYCMDECGLRAPKGRAAAIRWAQQPDVMVPLGRDGWKPGCIGVYHREGGAHVAFVVARMKLQDVLLGGNQGNAVSIAPRAHVLLEGFYWPAGVP